MQCYEACIKDTECNFWVWCASHNGCDEAGAFNGRYPYRGCELNHMLPHIPVQQWERGPLYSSISSGFITGVVFPLLAAHTALHVQLPCKSFALFAIVMHGAKHFALSPCWQLTLLSCTDHHPARSWVSKKLGMPGKAKDRVAVLTGIHPTPCTTPFGDYYMSLQVTIRALPDVCPSTLAAAPANEGSRPHLMLAAGLSISAACSGWREQ